MNKFTTQLLIFTLFILYLSSCDKNRIFEDYRSIPELEWHKDSLIVFKIPVTDTIQHYNLYLNIRNDYTYNYSNLWLFLNIVEPGGFSRKDTFEIVLADPTGKWLGKGTGGIKQSQMIYRKHIFFPVSGDYTITIQHGMRETNLKGITDAGFRVEKAN